MNEHIDVILDLINEKIKTVVEKVGNEEGLNEDEQQLFNTMIKTIQEYGKECVR